jgi:hypothetical protein
MAMILAGVFVLALGCGTQSYEKRLEKTIENMNYQKRLNASLTDAPVRGKLEELQIYVRPPKNMSGPTETFRLASVEPGRFDLESSFVEPEKQSLHLLARVKRPKTPAKKAPMPAETAPRGDFNTDVVDLIRSVYAVELDVGQLKEDNKRENTFKSKTIDLNEKIIQLYLYGGKDSPHEVALIFEYPKAERNAVGPKIALCLESFAAGERARRAFAGGDVEEEGSESPAEEASPTEVY